MTMLMVCEHANVSIWKSMEICEGRGYALILKQIKPFTFSTRVIVVMLSIMLDSCVSVVSPVDNNMNRRWPKIVLQLKEQKVSCVWKYKDKVSSFCCGNNKNSLCVEYEKPHHPNMYVLPHWICTPLCCVVFWLHYQPLVFLACTVYAQSRWQVHWAPLQIVTKLDWTFAYIMSIHMYICACVCVSLVIFIQILTVKSFYLLINQQYVGWSSKSYQYQNLIQQNDDEEKKCSMLSRCR